MPQCSRIYFVVACISLPGILLMKLNTSENWYYELQPGFQLDSQQGGAPMLDPSAPPAPQQSATQESVTAPPCVQPLQRVAQRPISAAGCNVLNKLGPAACRMWNYVGLRPLCQAVREKYDEGSRDSISGAYVCRDGNVTNDPEGGKCVSAALTLRYTSNDSVVPSSHTLTFTFLINECRWRLCTV